MLWRSDKCKVESFIGNVVCFQQHPNEQCWPDELFLCVLVTVYRTKIPTKCAGVREQHWRRQQTIRLLPPIYPTIFSDFRERLNAARQRPPRRRRPLPPMRTSLRTYLLSHFCVVVNNCPDWGPPAGWLQVGEIKPNGAQQGSFHPISAGGSALCSRLPSTAKTA